MRVSPSDISAEAIWLSHRTINRPMYVCRRNKTLRRTLPFPFSIALPRLAVRTWPAGMSSIQANQILDTDILKRRQHFISALAAPSHLLPLMNTHTERSRMMGW